MKSKQQRVIERALREVNKYSSIGLQKAARKKKMAKWIIILAIIITALIGLIWSSHNNFNSNTPIIPEVSAATIPKAEPLYITPRHEHSQEFTVTYYCGCSKCCGKWSDGYEHTATGAAGTQLTPYYSIAVDPGIIPLGTICYDSEGNAYEAVDTGSMVKGYHIDMFTGNHQEAVNLGKSTMVLNW